MFLAICKQPEAGSGRSRSGRSFDARLGESSLSRLKHRRPRGEKADDVPDRVLPGALVLPTMVVSGRTIPERNRPLLAARNWTAFRSVVEAVADRASGRSCRVNRKPTSASNHEIVDRLGPEFYAQFFTRPCATRARKARRTSRCAIGCVGAGNRSNQLPAAPVPERFEAARGPAEYAPARVFAEVPAPMLARLKSSLPRGADWRYEPKLDGFRGLLWRSGSGQVRLLSRNLKDLSLSFPELVRAGDVLPLNTVIDGEIVIAAEDGHADFGALQERLGVGGRAAGQVAQRRPAVLLAFDLVRRGGADLTRCPLRDRRENLEVLVAEHVPCLQLIAQTRVVEEAEEWLELLPSIEGVVAKRADGRYVAGQRDWIKVKRCRTVDCVVIGVAGDMTRPWLVLGLRHADGKYHRAGLARCSRGMAGSELTSIVAEALASPEESPIRSRWQHAAVPAWRRVPPRLVCELAYSTLDSNRWLRQPGRFLRWRPDRSPEDCWLEQLAHG